MLAVGLDIALAGGTARATLCLPAKGLLPSEHEQAEPVPVDTDTHVLGEVPLEISLRMPSTTVSAEDVDELAVGDVIRFDAAEPCSCTGSSTAPAATRSPS